jgi:competence protein ComEC
LQAARLTWIHEEAERWILWIPVFIGAGVLLYFHLDYEPAYYTGLSVLSLTAGSVLFWKRTPLLRAILLVIFLIALGFTAAQFQRWRVDAPTVKREMFGTTITGRLEQVSATPEGTKIILAEPTISYLKPEQTPRKIKLSLKQRQPELRPGQKVQLKGGLFPLPEPALPGGFDFARYFYFQQIGAVGYVQGPVSVLEDLPDSSLQTRLANARYRLSTYFRELMPGDAGAIAAALVVGDQAGISEATQEKMRVSGLAHMLSISGLHLGLVAAILFIFSRTPLLLVPTFALRFPIKKWAAGISLLGTFGYLALAGFPVAAERAFVMAALMLGAIILDRRVMSMRSLALAAIIILLWTPESLLGPSFQLSFAATLAIVALYEAAIDRPWVSRWRSGILGRFISYFAGILAVSLVAGLATAPFTIFHFNQFSVYQLLANLLASPIMSFLIMPASVLIVCLKPFGTVADFLVPFLEKGINWILAITEWVSQLPHAAAFVPAPSQIGILLISLGLIWFCLWLGRWRWAGIVMMLAGLATILAARLPDVLISEQAQQIAVRTENGYTMLKGGTNNFNASLWQEALGIEAWEASDIRCSLEACSWVINDNTLTWLKRREAVQDECGLAEVLIADFYYRCDLGHSVMRPYQATSIVLDNNEIAIRKASSYLMRRRD